MKNLFRSLCAWAILICFFTPLHAQNPVVIVNNPNSSRLEIRNGLLGLVIPKESTFNASAPQYTLAPIQAIIYKDGVYSDNTDNYLETTAPPTSLKVTITKETQDECIVVIQYNFNKPSFNDIGYGIYPGGGAGPGYYKTTISLKKGAKSAVIEVESDYDVSYTFKIANGLDPDQARYRGWSSNSVEDGYEPSGRPLQPANPVEATVDLNYSREKYFPFLSLWDQAGAEVNTGRYWQIFNSGQSSNANLLGFFQGRASRLLGGKDVGVRLVIKSDRATNRMASFANISLKRRGDDNSWYQKKRFQFGIFVSTKSDVLNPTQVQPIMKEMNYVSGLATKIDSYAQNSAVINPSFFEGALFLKPEKIQALIRRIKTDNAFYNKVIAMDSYFTPIADAWRSQAAATEAINSIISFGEYLKDVHKNGDGIHNQSTKYWMGSFKYKSYASQVSCLFADKSIQMTPEQKEALLGVVRMMARIEWDDDNVPFSDSSGAGLGTANMPFMYKNARNFFSLIFSNDPDFQDRAKKVFESTRADILNGIYKNGSTFGTPHYSQATIDPILFSMLQLKQAGVGNLFQEERERINKLTDFYSTLLTPPSVRFKNHRKLVSFGDGSEESAVSFALIASGLEDIDPALSKKLYSNFQNGAARLSIHGYIALAADLTQDYAPVFNSTSSNFEGYLSHLRSGINTNNETAAWVINGDDYFDHRSDDAGEINLYALKVPLSVSRSCFYYPHAPDARIRSVVIPESMFPQWNSGNQPIIGNTKPWNRSNQLEFAKLGNSTMSFSKMSGDGDWFRKIVMVTIKEDQPIIILYDSVTNNKPAIWSMPFMSQGAVSTPVGNVTPVDRLYDRDNNSQQLPVATSENGLNKGINKFSFTGQDWPKTVHPAGGIDWHMYNVSNSPGSFTMSQWTNNWQNSAEMNEYWETTGKEYKETQQFLRIKNTGPSLNILLPYFKGSNTYNNNSQLLGSGRVEIPYGNGKLLVAANSYYYSDNDKTIAASLSSQTFNEGGISIEGGVAEVEISNSIIKIRLHGSTGSRKITLPFSAELMVPRNDVTISLGLNSTEVNVNYANSNISLLSTEQGYTEILLVKKAVSAVCTGVSITASITPGKILCHGGTTTLTASSITGGAAPYTFSVNGGAFISALEFNSLAVAAGTHIVVVKDNNNCLSNAINVNVVSTNANIVLNVEMAACENSTGKIIATATGGSGQFKYSLNNSSNTTGLNTGIFTGVENGIYTVTVTDIQGCNKTSTQLTVNCANNPPPSACTGVNISANIIAGSIVCDVTTTTLTANNISGGTAPYTFSVNGGFFISQSSFNSLAVSNGVHTVVIKDSKGCTSNAYTVNVAAPKSALTLNIVTVCENNKGGITATATGGIGKLKFSLQGSVNTTGDATGIYTNIAEGPHTITVTDSLGCTKTSSEIVFDCSPNPSICTGVNISADIKPGVIKCNGGTTVLTSKKISGGKSPYTFSVNGGAFIDSTLFNQFPVSAGVHTVLVKDANGCISKAIAVNVASPGAPIMLNIGAAVCENGKGSITATAAGGSGQFQFKLNGTNLVNTSGVFSNVPKGTYTITVSDSLGCTKTGAEIVFDCNSNPPPSACADVNILANIVSGAIVCNGATTTLTTNAITGGTAPYTFSVNGGSFIDSVAFKKLAVSAGVQTVLVKDANGCTSNAIVVNVASPNAPIVLNVGAALCNNGTGSISAVAAGGSGPFKYSLNGSNMINTTGTFTNVLKGTYTITVTDSLGCTKTSSEIVFDCSPPPSPCTGVNISANINSGLILCNGGTTTFTANDITGGTAPYTFSVNGSSYIDRNAFNNLAISAGVHTIRIKDANGCISSAITVNVAAPGVAIILNVGAAVCENGTGSITATATGGSGQFKFNLNGTNLENTTGVFTKVPNGTYTISVTDSLGCTKTSSVVVFNCFSTPPVSVCAGVQISANIIAGSISCNSSTTTLMVQSITGGEAPYSFSVNGGSFINSTAFNSFAVSVGTHLVQVKDSKGCLSNAIFVNVPPANSSLILNIGLAHCENGAGRIAAIASGGGGQFQYTLNGSANTSGLTSGIFTNVPNGTYTITVVDALGCTKTSAEIIFDCISIPPPSLCTGVNISANITAGTILCNGSSTTMTANDVTGGTAPYSFSLNDGPFISLAAFNSLAVSAGTHSVIIKDANGCLSNGFIVDVTANSAIALNVAGGVCENGNGRVIATAAGGNGLFEYTLNYMSNTPGQTRPNVIANTSGITTGAFTGVVSGIYTVTVTDKLGCTVTSGEVVANCNIPVTLSGEAKDEDALLNWQIPLSNIKHFNIQHSTDGINFTTIDTINAKNEKPFEAYHYVHLKPANQNNHYRLQIETKDGTSYFSNAVFVKVEKKITGLTIYPNPVHDKLHFQTSGNATAVLQILDATGKLVRNEYLELRGLTTTTLDVSNITNGVYHLVLIKQGVRLSAKFVKQ